MGESSPDCIRVSTARKFAASTASGASARTAILTGPSMNDSAYWASAMWPAVVGCTPSAKRNVVAASGVTKLAAVHTSDAVVPHAGMVTLAMPKAAGLAISSSSSLATSSRITLPPS